MSTPTSLQNLRARPDAADIDVFTGGSWVPLTDLAAATGLDVVDWRMRHGGKPAEIPAETEPTARIQAAGLRAVANDLERQAAGLRRIALTLDGL